MSAKPLCMHYHVKSILHGNNIVFIEHELLLSCILSLAYTQTHVVLPISISTFFFYFFFILFSLFPIVTMNYAIGYNLSYLPRPLILHACYSVRGRGGGGRGDERFHYVCLNFHPRPVIDCFSFYSSPAHSFLL